MSSTILLVFALVLVLEELDPMLYPSAWKGTISVVAQLPENILRRLDGDLVIASVVVHYVLRKMTD